MDSCIISCQGIQYVKVDACLSLSLLKIHVTCAGGEVIFLCALRRMLMPAVDLLSMTANVNLPITSSWNGIDDHDRSQYFRVELNYLISKLVDKAGLRSRVN